MRGTEVEGGMKMFQRIMEKGSNAVSSRDSRANV